VPDLTPAWSPLDDRILFHRPTRTPSRNQLWWVTADAATKQILVPASEATGSTFASVGVLRERLAPVLAALGDTTGRQPRFRDLHARHLVSGAPAQSYRKEPE
jgi:hypothetical protein